MLVILKQNNRFYFGTAKPPLDPITTGDDIFMVPDNLNIWPVPGKKHMIMGLEHSLRDCDLLRYRSLPFNDVNEKNVTEILYPLIYSTFEKHHRLYNEKYLGMSVFIADGKQAFEIQSDGLINRIRDFHSSDYMDFIRSDVMMTKDRSAPFRMVSAYETLLSVKNNTVFPIAILDTNNTTIRYIASWEDV